MTHPKQKIHLSKKYLAWIRKKDCLTCGAPGPSDAHHVFNSGKKNHGNDFLAVPLDRRCHSEYHQKGHSEFESKWNLDFKDEIINLLAEFLDQGDL